MKYFFIKLKIEIKLAFLLFWNGIKNKMSVFKNIDCKLGLHKLNERICPSSHIEVIQGQGPFRYQKKYFECPKCGFSKWAKCNMESINDKDDNENSTEWL